MLLRVGLNNFKSFRKFTEIDFTKTNYKILEDTNVYDSKILKGAIFVGGNATGKTNIILSLKILLEMLFSDKIVNLCNYRCLYSGLNRISLDYEFDIDDNLIKYYIKYDRQKKVLLEKLHLNDKLILDRIGDFAETEITEAKTHTDLDNDILFLRTIYFNTKFNNNKVLKKWFEFLSNSVYIDASENSKLNSNSKEVIKEYLEKNSIDNINNFFKENNFNQQIEYSNKSVGKLTSIELYDTSDKQIFFKRKGIDEPIPYEWESLGNKNLLAMLPPFFNVINNGGMLIIDEFSSAFHNELERLLIRYFMEKSNNSQIFLVSHSTNLLSNSIFRPDQAYSVDFTENGSIVNRFSDEKPREAQNIEKMYNSGCFGGIPNYKPDYID